MNNGEAHPFTKLAKPAQRALANAGIKTLEELSRLTEAEMKKLHGIGKNALQTLKAAMAVNGLSFVQKI
jgi:DNA-directed RNA polymerase alpha subunit